MEPHEYETLYRFESTYWWYLGQRAIFLDFLKRLKLRADARILDAGCGTGKTLETVIRDTTPHSFGFDVSDIALTFCRARGIYNVCLASINAIPFHDNTFDLVFSIDVLGSAGVNEKHALNELCRVVRPGGHIIVILPAYQWMLSEHDKAVHSVRRYNKRQLAQLLKWADMRVLRITYLLPTLFPFIAAYRIIRRRFFRNQPGCTVSDLYPLPRILNKVLLSIVHIERQLLRGVCFPYGSSVLAIAQKVRP